MYSKTEKQENNNKGQILVMSLFILLVLSIITLSMIVVLSVDTQKKVYNESYDENYYYSEYRLQQTAEFISKQFSPPSATNLAPATITAENGSVTNVPSVAGITVGELLNELNSLYSSPVNNTTGVVATPSCANILGALGEVLGIRCEILEGTKTTEIEIRLQNFISGLEVTANDTIQLNLWNEETNAPYTGTVGWSWTNTANTIWSVSYIYERNYFDETTGTNIPHYEIVKDIYDCRVLSGSCSMGRFSESQNGSLPLDQAIQISTLNTSMSDPFVGTNFVKPVYLRLRPIITNNAATTISIVGDGSTNFPAQFAEIKAQSYEEAIGDAAPSPLLSIKLPIVAAPPAMFDYVYYQSR